MPSSGGTPPIRLTITDGASAAGRSERQAEDRAQVVLELARDGAVDRPVTGVVDARRVLVREQPAADLEQLEREHADVVELVEQPRRELLRLGLRRAAAGARETRRIPSRCTFSASGQNRVSPFAAAHGDDRELAVEVDDLLRELVVAEPRLGRLEAPLALAVVPEPPRLDERGQPGVASEPNRAVGIPRRRKSSFSTSRSWPSSSARGGGSGADGARRPRRARSRTRT